MPEADEGRVWSMLTFPDGCGKDCTRAAIMRKVVSRCQMLAVEGNQRCIEYRSATHS
jgi:hypothetical protein